MTADLIKSDKNSRWNQLHKGVNYAGFQPFHYELAAAMP
jgi:hypothetical protein